LLTKNLSFRTKKKEKRAAELKIAAQELIFQNEEKRKTGDLQDKKLEKFSYSLKLALNILFSLIEASLDH